MRLGTKRCSSCKETKPNNAFHRHRGRKGGLRPDCKACALARQRQSYIKNSKNEAFMEKGRARAARWRKEHPEKHRENWGRRKNSEKKRISERRWRKENRDTVNAYNHKRRARLRGAGGSFTAKQWKGLCAAYGNRCLCCGTSEEKLTQDHVKPLACGGDNWITNIQPLCKRCNSGKGAREWDYRPDNGEAARKILEADTRRQ